jgi:hypothetical protein
MIEPGGGFGFRAKPPDIRGRGQVRPQNHFDGHDPPQADLPGAVNHAHPAAADFLQQLVIPKPFAHWLRHRRPLHEIRRANLRGGAFSVEAAKALGEHGGRVQFPQFPSDRGMLLGHHPPIRLPPFLGMSQQFFQH